MNNCPLLFTRKFKAKNWTNVDICKTPPARGDKPMIGREGNYSLQEHTLQSFGRKERENWNEAEEAQRIYPQGSWWHPTPLECESLPEASKRRLFCSNFYLLLYINNFYLLSIYFQFLLFFISFKHLNYQIHNIHTKKKIVKLIVL